MKEFYSNLPDMGVYLDSNPFFIYTGTWKAGSNPLADGTETTQTIHTTNTLGSSLSFYIFGRFFSITANIPAGNGSVLVDYSIDGGHTTRQVQPSGSKTTQTSSFIESPTLVDGPHSVMITNAGDDTDSSFMFGGLLVVSGAPESQPLLINGLTSSAPPSAIPASDSPLPPPLSSNTAPQPVKQSTHFAGSPTPPVIHSTTQSIPSESLSAQTSSQATSAADEGSSGTTPTLTGGSTPNPVATVHTTDFVVGTNSDGAFTTFSTVIKNFTTTLPMGSGPSVSGSGSGGSSTSKDASPRGASAHVLLASVISASVVVSIVLFVIGFWIFRRRRVLSRFRSGIEDEQHLFRSDSRQTIMSTTPRPFRVEGQRFTTSQLSPDSKGLGDESIPSVTDGGVKPYRAFVGGLFHKSNQRNIQEGSTHPVAQVHVQTPSPEMTRIPSSITVITLAPQYESRISSWHPPNSINTDEGAESDVPPTYHTD